MKKAEVIVKLKLENKLLVELVNNRIEETHILDIIEQLTDKECRDLLVSGYSDFDIGLFTKEAIVKKVIDNFDPFIVMPGEDGPEDEYDGESRRITEKIEAGMSEKEIAEIIEKEFIYSFGADFPFEVYMWLAEDIHYYLNRL